MKFLFIFTGGTIGSTLENGFVSTDKSKPLKIIEAYKNRYKEDLNYNFISPLTILSENLTGKYIKVLTKTIAKNLNKNYDAILVMHGTDTLQFSACATSYAFAFSPIPIMFVSANYPLENPLSNGLENLKGAIEFVKQAKCGGVFVSYKNRGEQVKIHCATRLCFSKSFSDEVCSVKNIYYGEFNENFIFKKNPKFIEKKNQINALSTSKIKDFSKEILWITQYPAMPYPNVKKSIKYVLINSYHSGTINTLSKEAKEFFEKAKKLNVKVYVLGVEESFAYESTKLFKEYSITPLYNISPISAYVKLWLLSSLKMDLSMLNSNLSNDLF